MADADLQLKAQLDVSDAQRKFKQLGDTGNAVARDIQQEMTSALEKSTAETKKLAGAMQKTGEKARMSGEQIGSMAMALSGLAVNLASVVARNQGAEDTADYLGGIGGGMLTGAAAGAAGGPLVAALAAIAGGAIGGVSTYFEHDTRDKNAAAAEAEAKRKAAAATEKLIQANTALVEKYDQLQAASKESEAFFDRLGDTTRSVGERQDELNDRLSKFKASGAKLRDTLTDPATLAAPAKFKEAFDAFTRNQAEVRKMEGYEISDGTKSSTAAGSNEPDAEKRASLDTDSLQKLGISIAGGRDYGRETLQTAQEQLAELRKLNEKDFGGGVATWQ